MDVFVGKWDLKKSENFQEFMDALGVDDTTRQRGSESKPTLRIKVNGDTIQVKTKKVGKTHEINFKLGEEFDETTLDGRQVKSVVTLDDGKLKHVQKWDGREMSLVREVNGNDLTLTLTIGDVVSTRLYQKSE